MELDWSGWAVIIGSSVLFIALIWWKFRRDILFLFSKTKAEGTIVNWMAAMQDGKRVYYPMIEFETKEKGKITFRAEEMCEGEPMYERGTPVTVFYLPGDVEKRKVVYPS